MKLSEIFTNYYEVRAELMDAVKDLTRQQLYWTTPDYPASIGSLLAHIAETEYWWITVVAERKVTPEEADFKRFEQQVEPETLLTWLDQYFGETKAYLERESLDDWDEVYYRIPGRDHKFTKKWLAWHVVEHQARHRGQIFMLMRMQGIDVPVV